MGEQSGTRAQRHSGWLQRGPAEASTATVAAMVPGLRPVPGAVSFFRENVSMVEAMYAF